MIHLGIDITTWGKFDDDTYKRLTEYCYDMLREGYRSYPEILFVTRDQYSDILAYVDANKLPLAQSVNYNPQAMLPESLKRHPDNIREFTLHTPMNVMWVRVSA